MRVKTSELSGAALDYAMAVASGLSQFIVKNPMGFANCAEAGYWLWECPLNGPNKLQCLLIGRDYSPSTKADQIWRVIEEELGVLERRSGYFYAWKPSTRRDRVTSTFATVPGNFQACAHGATVEVAVAKCYVGSELGLEVEIPEDLT